MQTLRTTSPSVWLGLAAALVVGAVLRLIWGLDIEYKFDEQWMFERTQRAGVEEELPLHGMPTSAGFLNPGLNVWIFVGLARTFGVVDPPGLAKCVQIASILALLVLLLFAVRLVPREQREPWLWAIALMALNPIAVVYHRKIWQPCLFPLAIAAFLIVWWKREKGWASFLWGLLGALLGQIQMAGFFFAGGFALWTLLFDRRSVRWKWWLAGSVVGTLPLLPWLHYLATRPETEAVRNSSLWNLLVPKFWLRWLTYPLGLGANFVLGSDFRDLLRYPVINGTPTYLVGVLHLVLVGLAGLILVRGGRWAWAHRSRWRDVFTGQGSRTFLALAAAAWGFGLLMTASTMQFHRHYMLVALPLPFVWLAWLALARKDTAEEKPAPRRRPWLPSPRATLAALCVVQGLISLAMLGYIHVNQRRIRGDFGVPYGAQIRAGGSDVWSQIEKH